uniref:Family with sequence similarity 83 member Fa n=1 Tax=Poecilia reticulata TaxID=8081 RepID=A0A3P9PAJ2_POERE
MAESQLLCLDNQHVNEKVPESRPEFYYSEEQRAALEQLLRHGDGAFRMRLQEDNIRDFLCAREVRAIRDGFQEYDPDSEPEPGEPDKPKEATSADSGVHSTYWPQMSDTEVPALDIGWPACSGVYKGVTRVSVYTHPPKEPGPHIKEVVRRLIQGAQKVLAIVMDLLTDLQILQDLLDAAARRGVAVYAVLEARGVPHFLDMSSRLQINAMHLRVRRQAAHTAQDSNHRLLCFFTWSSSRLDRSAVTVMTGQIVDFFDSDFREMYAVSEPVDLHKEQADFKVPAHKYHNPKYSLVFGNSLGLTGSLQDLSTQSHSLLGGTSQRDTEGHGDTVDRLSSPSPSAAAEEEEKDGRDGVRKSEAAAVKKPRSSFRNFLKSRAANHRAETIQEGVATPPSPAPVATAPEANGVAGNEPEDSFEVQEKPARLKPKKPQKNIQRSVSLQTIGPADQDGTETGQTGHLLEQTGQI